MVKTDCTSILVASLFIRGYLMQLNFFDYMFFLRRAKAVPESLQVGYDLHVNVLLVRFGTFPSPCK